GADAMLQALSIHIFWSFACVTVFSSYISQKHLERGSYQLLYSFSGMISVFYTEGYFILHLQVLNPHLSHTLIYPFTFFKSGNLSLLFGLAIQLFFALGLGLLTGMGNVIRRFKNNSDRVVKWLFVMVILESILVAIFSQDYRPYHLLPLLPFGLILTAIPVGYQYGIGLGQS
ncbi:DUF2079 domain-containing protein, partial [Enterococcus faecalis]